MGLMSAAGGLLASKLAKATAAVGDVVQGKTFYAGDKTLKTGTLRDLGNEPKATDVGLYNDGMYFYPMGSDSHEAFRATRAVYASLSDVYNTVPGGNRGAWGSTINPGGSVTIPQGWHNGNGVVKANGNSINFHPIDRTVGWGSGVRFTGEDATPGASGKMRFVLKYWCRTEYNVNGYIKVLRNGSEIHSTTFNKTYDSPYNDDAPNGYINVEFSGSGTYQIQVSVDYHAGNGEIKMGGAFIGY